MDRVVTIVLCTLTAPAATDMIEGRWTRKDEKYVENAAALLADLPAGIASVRGTDGSFFSCWALRRD